MKKTVCIIAILLAAPTAFAQDAKDAAIRELKAMVKLQAAHIKSLKAQIADLKSQIAAAKDGAATRPAATKPKPPVRPAAPKRKPVRPELALKRKITRMEFKSTPLHDVFQWMRAVSNTNIHVNWRSLADVGIDKSTDVTLSLTSMTLKKALLLVLDSAGARKLDFDVDKGALVISSRLDFDKRTTSATYNILPLVGRSGTPAAARRVDELIALIRKTVSPESWRDNGGQVGTIQALGSRLVITQNKKNHQAVAELIKSLQRR
ncbi:MAG: hypothetical protein QGH60_08965 [Phycisphaerae bacterium]|jgi:hypothetical protein|nr:hypothetical protein [Phycisphaerae bacterium]